jgi:hypothetical protein
MRTRTKILITAAMLGVVGVLIAVATSALFSASTTSGTNIAATGSLSITADKLVYFDNSAVGAVKLRPVASLIQARADNTIIGGDVTVTNTSATPTSVSLREQQVGGTGLAPGMGLVAAGTKPAVFKKLQMCVSLSLATDCSQYSSAFDVAPPSTDGTGDSVDSNVISTFVLAPGATQQLHIEVWMQDDAQTNNDYVNQTATALFRFDAS